MGLVQDTYDNMCRVMPRLRRKDDEGVNAYKRRVEEFIAERWGRSAITVRAWRHRKRRPDSKCKQFFRDLRKYGAIRFNTKAGTVMQNTYDKGATMEEFLESEPTGYDPKYYAAKREKLSAKRPAKRSARA